MQRKKTKIIVISGPSGSGKNTVLDALLADTALNLDKIVTCTTRPIREVEVDGKDHHFLTKDHFREMIQKGEIIEYNLYNGHFYGTPKKEIEKRLKAERNLVMEIDINGMRSLKKYFPDNVESIFIDCDLGTLRKRLLERGCHTEKAIEERLLRAVEEKETSIHYDHVVDNSTRELECTLAEIKELIQTFDK